jgi:hypothetical protein
MVGNDDNDEESYNVYDEFMFHQSHLRVDKNWIILDNCSTTDIFCNRKILSNIRDADTTLKIHCNAGSKVIRKVGTLHNYGMVWYSKDAISNILSLAQVEDRFPVKYDFINGNVCHREAVK